MGGGDEEALCNHKGVSIGIALQNTHELGAVELSVI